MSQPRVGVCMFSYYFPPRFSGAGLYAVSLAKELSAGGVDVSFLTVGGDGLATNDRHCGFPVHRIMDGPRKHGELVLWANMLRALWPRRHSFDILHATGSTYRNSGVGPVARLLGKRSLTVISMAHNDLKLLDTGVAGWVQAQLLRCVDRYVSLSRQITDEARRLPLDARRIVEIPQGVDVRRFFPADAAEKAPLRHRHGLPLHNIALYVGVVDRRKNVEWVVRTWARHRAIFEGWHLVIVGPASRDRRDHDLRATLQRFVHDEKLDQRILFRDFTPTIEDYYRAADFFVLPSENEGMPNAVLEAMAAGLPCLVTRISGTTDLITPGETGMLFTYGSESEFLENALTLLNNAALRQTLGARARSRVVAEYSTARAADRYLAVYHELLARR